MDKTVKCEKCTKWISKKVADYSFSKWKMYLCYEHQLIQKLIDEGKVLEDDQVIIH